MPLTPAHLVFHIVQVTIGCPGELRLVSVVGQLSREAESVTLAGNDFFGSVNRWVFAIRFDEPAQPGRPVWCS